MSTDNSKRCESVGRKAVGLKSRSWDYDSQVAEGYQYEGTVNECLFRR